MTRPRGARPRRWPSVGRLANADEAERERRLPAATVAALVDADLMRMALPAAYGGPEADPLTMVDGHRGRRPRPTAPPGGAR